MIMQPTMPYDVHRVAHVEHLPQVVRTPQGAHVSRMNVTPEHSPVQNRQWGENRTISSPLEKASYQRLRQSICASDLEPVIHKSYTIKEQDRGAIHDIRAKLHNPRCMLRRAQVGYADVTPLSTLYQKLPSHMWLAHHQHFRCSSACLHQNANTPSTFPM